VQIFAAFTVSAFFVLGCYVYSVESRAARRSQAKYH
jgi:hypothetical protein